MMCVGADVMYIKETNILISYMSTQRESFEGQHGGPPSEARRASEGGSGGPPPEIFKKPVLQMVQSEVFLSYIL